MNSGLSFCLALLAALFVSLVIATAMGRMLRRLDELDAMEARRREWAKLDLASAGDPPPCVRELDPNGPFDWARLAD